MEFRKSQARDLFETVVITAIIALFTTTFVVQAFKIPTGSMESNLLIGDHLLVNKFVYGQSGIFSIFLPQTEPKRGDVIVFKYPEKPDEDSGQYQNLFIRTRHHCFDLEFLIAPAGG